MIKRVALSVLGAVLMLATPHLHAAEDGAPSIGVVDFRRCLEDSKFGRQERDSLAALQKRLSSVVEETEKQLLDLTDKLRDPEYRDSLSPEAEEGLRMQHATLSQQIQQQQNQFYQMIGQSEMKLMQELNVQVMRASQILSKKQSLDFVVRDEACFFFLPAAEITDQVIAEMDKLYATESGEEA